jgi:hypothetical protein
MTFSCVMTRVNCGTRDCAAHIGELDLLCKGHLEAGIGGEGRCEPDICRRHDENEKGDDGERAVNFVHEGCQWEKDKEREY